MARGRVRPLHSIGFLYVRRTHRHARRALLSPRETDVRARAYIIAGVPTLQLSYVRVFEDEVRRRGFAVILIRHRETPRVLFRSSSYRPIAQALTYNL